MNVWTLGADPGAGLGTALALFVFWGLALGLVFSPVCIIMLWWLERGGKK